MSLEKAIIQNSAAMFYSSEGHMTQPEWTRALGTAYPTTTSQITVRKFNFIFSLLIAIIQLFSIILLSFSTLTPKKMATYDRSLDI